MQPQTVELPPKPRRRANGKTLTNGHAKEPEAQAVPAPLVAKQRRQIAIFGTTPSRMSGPVQDNTGWDRWTIGPGGKDVHNWERIFEVHGVWPADFAGYLNDLSLIEPPRQLVTIPQPNNAAESWTGAIHRWHQMHNLPLDTLKGQWKSVVRYPREIILDKYGRRMWFSSSISYCIALAIEEEATDIGLWGIDLESGEEYISQFVGCAHFLDLARLHGINVHLPKDCGLLRDPNPYPDRYETNLALTLEKKVKFVQHALAQMEPELKAAEAELHRQEGRLMLMRELNAPMEKQQEAERNLMQINHRVGQLACNINQLKGELGASQFYQRYFVWGLNEPSEFKLNGSVG